jgi:outer membrane protein assembly factor BamB
MVEKREVLDERRKVTRKRIRNIILAALGVFVLTISLLVLFQCTDVVYKISEDVQSSPQSNDWSMFRRDLAHTGNAGDNSTLPQGTLKWTFTTGAVIHSSPAVVDGVVYIGSRDGYFYALDADTGEKIWSFKADSFVDSSPAVVGGVVYVGSNDGNLYALDAKTGEKIWAFDTEYGVRSSPAVAGGVVYFGCENSRVYAVDAATGEELWHGYTEHSVDSSPVVSRGIVLIGSQDNLFYSFNAGTGNARMQFDSLFPIIGSPAVQDGVAYFANNGGFFTAMNIMGKNWWQEQKITEYWKVFYMYGIAPAPPKPSGYLWSMSLGYQARTVSSPTVIGNFAYLGTGNNLVSIDLTKHEVQWTFATGSFIYSSPAVVGGVVYVGGEDGYLYAIDRATGVKLWDIATGGKITSSPAVANGVIYIGCHDGKVYAIK